MCSGWRRGLRFERLQIWAQALSPLNPLWLKAVRNIFTTAAVDWAAFSQWIAAIQVWLASGQPLVPDLNLLGMGPSCLPQSEHSSAITGMLAGARLLACASDCSRGAPQAGAADSDELIGRHWARAGAGLATDTCLQSKFRTSGVPGPNRAREATEHQSCIVPFQPALAAVRAESAARSAYRQLPGAAAAGPAATPSWIPGLGWVSISLMDPQPGGPPVGA